MVERQRSARFVGGAHVFPGGRVDPDDSLAADLCVGLDDAAASRRLNVERGGLAHYVAAIRECFEEAGVLLAYDAAGRPIGADGGARRSGARGSAARAQCARGGVPRAGARRTAGASPSIACTTGRTGSRPRIHRSGSTPGSSSPPSAPIRAAAHDEGELAGSEWVRPLIALRKAELGEWTIIFPTLKNLTTLLGFATVARGRAKRAPAAATSRRSSLACCAVRRGSRWCSPATRAGTRRAR